MNSVLRSVAFMAATGALLAGTATQANATSPADASGRPCTTTITPASAGKRLNVGLVCTAPHVVIVRLDFQHTVKLVGQRPFGGARCSGQQTNIWYCVFVAGVPVGTPVTGALVLQQRALPSSRSVRTTFYTSATIGSAVIELDPGWTEMLSY
jgi:hypothetical protein